MKTFLLSLYLVSPFFYTYSQNTTFNWAVQNGGSGTCNSFSTTTDAFGNVYITGSFFGTVDFDPSAAVNNLTANGNDIYIQKLDSDGNSIWVKQIGDAGSDRGFSIAIDGSGNVYVTGASQGPVDFDPNAGIHTSSAYGLDDIFALKLTTNGDFVWVSTMGGISSDIGNSLSVDASGNVFITGEFSNTADFDPGTGTTSLSTNGNKDAFVLKLNNDGSLAWVNQIGTAGLDKALGINTDVNNNIYVTGNFTGTADFEPGAGVTSLTSVAGSDIFVLKLNNNGGLIWVKQIGGNGNDEGYAIEVDANQNVFITGAFSGTCDFDPGMGTSNLTAVGNFDAFVQKLDNNGDAVWVAQMGGASTEYGLSISLDSDGNVYTTGSFLASVDFDPGTGTTSLISNGLNDLFIHKLDSSGELVWVEQIGGTANDVGRAIHVNAFGSVFLAGFFSSTVDFDPSSGVENMTSGSTDAFVIRLDQCSPNTGTDIVVACNSHLWINNITYTQDNNIATHTLTNVAGCDSVVTLNLTINSVNSSATLSDPTITADEAAATYRWLDCNDNYAVISGENNQSYTPSANGSYAVEVTMNGCTDTSDCQLVQTIGLQENSIDYFSVFPNPSIDGNWKFEPISSEIKVFDLLGRQLDLRIDNINGIIEGNHLPNGNYIVHVITVNGLVVRSISILR